MTEREKARRALKALESIRAKQAEARRTAEDLHRLLQEQAYEQRRNSHKGINIDRCSVCGRPFIFRDEVLEFVDDDGMVVDRRHYPNCANPWPVR